jgi:nucleoside-diphosphate-sugar epimerase
MSDRGTRFLWDLVGLIGDVMSRPDLIRLGARETVVEEAPVVVADTTRLRTEVGWTPRHTLRSGVEATIAYWREQTAPLLGEIQ